MGNISPGKGIKHTKVLKFPSNVGSNPTWVKYEVYRFLPISSASKMNQHRGNTHLGVTVSKEIVGEVSLLEQSQMTITESQSWSQEAAGGIIDQLVAKGVGGLSSGGPGGAIEAVISGGEGIKDTLVDQKDKWVSKFGGLGGVAVADKLALNYKGPDGVRSFTMEHTFIPRSKKESDLIREIINYFRASSSPELNREEGEKNKGSFYTSYKFPHLFKVIRMAGNDRNKNYPPYDICYCKGVSVKYGDEMGTTFFDDASPISYNLSLSFEEIAIQNKDQIENEN